MTLFYWGAENHPAYAGSEVREIDPAKVVRNQSHRLVEKMVRMYMDHPRRVPDDGDVLVRELGDDTFEYYGNGAHRLEAARRAGRRIVARVYPRDHRPGGKS
jgi:hypothetical protein